MEKVIIWFNHWFSTAYHIVNLIKEDNNTNFYVIGTNKNEENVMKTVCDYWEKEPDISNDEEYIEYCLEFCLKHSINIFIPRKNQTLIAKNIKRFENISVKVLVERDYKKIKQLNNKKDTYELFKMLEIGDIPEYYVVDTAEKFIEGYEKLKRSYKKMCIKFIEDEGATSFRVIDDSIKDSDIFLVRKGLKVTSEEVYNSLKKREDTVEIMLMPYLEGEEVSVDCLKTKDGLIAIPRIKTLTRTEIIRYDKEILDICEDFFNKYGIEYPCNIQFKYSNGTPYLLEINTRMSGGIHYTCLASKINIPNIAVNQLLGIDKNWENDKKETKVSYIEMPILI